MVEMSKNTTGNSRKQSLQDFDLSPFYKEAAEDLQLLNLLKRRLTNGDRSAASDKNSLSMASPSQIIRLFTAKTDSDFARDLFLFGPEAVPLLLVGESGTGKTLLARAIHLISSRSKGDFVEGRLNELAAGDIGVARSELFGHERGAFTGAASARKGIFEQASGGTLFLDELLSAGPQLQAMLLHFVENGQYRPVGSLGSGYRSSNARIVLATSGDLGAAVKDRTLREDLYFRVKNRVLSLPALRDRGDELEELCIRLAAQAVVAARMQERLTSISGEAMQALMAYGWPGNIRELQETMQNAVIRAKGDASTCAIALSHLGHFNTSAKELSRLPPKEGEPTRGFLEHDQNSAGAVQLFPLRNNGARAYSTFTCSGSLAGVPPLELVASGSSDLAALRSKAQKEIAACLQEVVSKAVLLLRGAHQGVLPSGTTTDDLREAAFAVAFWCHGTRGKERVNAVRETVCCDMSAYRTQSGIFFKKVSKMHGSSFDGSDLYEAVRFPPSEIGIKQSPIADRDSLRRSFHSLSWVYWGERYAELARRNAS